MFRRWFYALSAVAMAIALALAWYRPSARIAPIILLPLIALGLYDSFQKHHTILRNFPLIGHFRYLLELVRPEIQQYFIETDLEAYPVEREYRSLVYQRAKGTLETLPFGTPRDMYRDGYEWASHSLAPVDPPREEPRVQVGGPECTQPYSASLLNISAMSFGALSSNAIAALNRGARKGGFAHDTGEGGISPYHLEGGGDLIWQIGTAYFGCRKADGSFDADLFAQNARLPNVRMIELKLSQGAKPGHGGVLPGVKVTEEIARMRGIPVGRTIVSPPGHRTFNSPAGLLEFIQRLRTLSGGKPVGFKLCVGSKAEFLSICKAMIETGIAPDFITVDGGEGGTGAAPIEFSESMGMPARDGWMFVHDALVGAGLRDRMRLFVSGKIFTGFHMIRAMALGADACFSARGMMFALGCIQALRCNTDRCPTGVATQNPALVYGLDVPDKAERVYRFHQATVRSCLELVGAMGLRHPKEVRPEQVYRRVDQQNVRHFGELYDRLSPGQLLKNGSLPEGLRIAWEAADSHRWPSASPSRDPGGPQVSASSPAHGIGDIPG